MGTVSSINSKVDAYIEAHGLPINTTPDPEEVERWWEEQEKDRGMQLYSFRLQLQEADDTLLLLKELIDFYSQGEEPVPQYTAVVILDFLEKTREKIHGVGAAIDGGSV